MWRWIHDISVFASFSRPPGIFSCVCRHVCLCVSLRNAQVYTHQHSWLTHSTVLNSSIIRPQRAAIAASKAPPQNGKFCETPRKIHHCRFTCVVFRFILHPKTTTVSGARCSAPWGFCPTRGLSTPWNLESIFDIFVISEFTSDRHCHARSSCRHSLLSGFYYSSLYVSRREPTLAADVRQSTPRMR